MKPFDMPLQMLFEDWDLRVNIEVEYCHDSMEPEYVHANTVWLLGERKVDIYPALTRDQVERIEMFIEENL